MWELVEGDAGVWQIKPATGGVSAPTTVSGAVRLAIIDGRALLAEGDRYTFHHGAWHNGSYAHSMCAICAAGAVMARRFGVWGKTVSPSDFGPAWERVLRCIDAVRETEFGRAWMEIASGDSASREADWFKEEVVTRLCNELDDTLGTFVNNDEYAEFLHDLETAVLPAIERAEAAVARRTRTRREKKTGCA